MKGVDRKRKNVNKLKINKRKKINVKEDALNQNVTNPFSALLLLHKQTIDTRSIRTSPKKAADTMYGRISMKDSQKTGIFYNRKKKRTNV